MTQRPMYFDYAATTPIDPRVADKMHLAMTQTGVFGNAASLHAYGREALLWVEEAREKIAVTIGAESSEIIFTSGATEANNLALKGAMAMYQRRGRHLITFKSEHKAVLDPAMQLEKEGMEVTYLSPLSDGSLDIEALLNAIRSDTVLISLMHVNNETGVINDIERVANITREKGILLHVDAAQSVGKLPLDLRRIQADLVSLSAHKVYGPKGIGALYLRKKPRVRVYPLIQGGGHEQGLRSGTLPVHQIVGMGEAFAIAATEQASDSERIALFNARIRKVIEDHPRLSLNTQHANCVPHILNIQFQGQLADALLAEWKGIAASTAAACQGKSIEGSHVLRAMGLTRDQVLASIRFSFGRFTTEEEMVALLGLL